MTMFPEPPFPGFGWPLNHHMGLVNQKSLYYFLLAAATYADSPDPALHINEHIASANLFTRNVRSDSGQPDAWRDYQQVLSELGLIYSTRLRKRITPTALGLSYLDGSLSFSEVVTLQALRYQYPNGHNSQIHGHLRVALMGTPLVGLRPLSRLQHVAGVRIRPAVLIWEVLRGLQIRQSTNSLTVNEIDRYLLRCSTHSDTEAAIDAILASRTSGPTLPMVSKTRHATRRNVEEWIRFLQLTPLFSSSNNRYIAISEFGIENKDSIDALTSSLTDEDSFWEPVSYDDEDRLRWYSWFGSVDLSLDGITNIDNAIGAGEYQEGSDSDDERGIAAGSIDIGQINLREFSPVHMLASNYQPRFQEGLTIDTAYSATLAERQHRLHDQMIILIANVCRANGALLWDDPRSVDLLVSFQGTEYIVEVKSATPRNFVQRLRLALGQVTHYDYMLSVERVGPRRKVIAIAARIPESSWVVDFLNRHVGIDLLSLSEGRLIPYTNESMSQRLFTSP